MLAHTSRLAPRVTRTLALAGVMALAACADRSPTSSITPTGSPLASRGTESNENDDATGGAVFVSTNATSGNAVVAFRRASDGTLSPLGTYATGGAGIGGMTDPLASQFALTLSPDKSLLFVVNAGSNDVSVLRVSKHGLRLVGRTSSGGTRPVSVAASKHALYVLNTGSNDIGIFRYADDGQLERGRLAPLGAGAAGAAAIRVSPDGRFLTVTERVSNTIDSYVITGGGRLGPASRIRSTGIAPFGFDYAPNGLVVVSEAGSASASSYAQHRDGSLEQRSPFSVSTGGQGAPCWLIVDHAGRFAYTANAGGSSISGFAIGNDGALSLITVGGRTGDLGTGAQPLDLDISRDSRYLYVMKNGTGTIGAFSVKSDGSLTGLDDTPGLVARGGYMGLAAY